MEDVGAPLMGTLLLMFVGALLCGAAPFFLRIRETHLQTLAALGAGLLIGSALAVIVPEGFHAFAEVGQTGVRGTAGGAATSRATRSHSRLLGLYAPRAISFSSPSDPAAAHRTLFLCRPRTTPTSTVTAKWSRIMITTTAAAQRTTTAPACQRAWPAWC